MWRRPGIDEPDWQLTRAGVRTVLLSPHHEAYALKMRSTARQKQISHLQQQLSAAAIQNLKDLLAIQQKHFNQKYEY